MKRKLFLLTSICVLLSLLCGCAHEIPDFLPGEHEEDGNFVWLCKDPFAVFSSTDDYRYLGSGHLKGYIQGEKGFTCFYMVFNSINGRTYFRTPEIEEETSEYDCFWGDAYYYENYFNVETVCDKISFFDGALPTLQFEKIAKDDFLTEYEDYGHLIT